MSEEKLLFNQSLMNRGAYRSKQVQQQQRSDHAQETTITVLGYDSNTGNFRVKDRTNKVFYAKAISNSGALSIGSQASLVSPSGATPIIDAMPR